MFARLSIYENVDLDLADQAQRGGQFHPSGVYRRRRVRRRLGRPAAVVGGRRSAAVVRRSQMAFGAWLVAVLLATTSLTAGAAWGATGGVPGTGDKSFNPAHDTEGNHCVSPDGVDGNAVLGISEALFMPGACDVFEAGEFYVPLGPGSWLVNDHWGAVPADYTPSAPTPAEDYVSKLRWVTYVVDPGRAHSRSYRYRAQDIVEVRALHDFLPLSAPAYTLVLLLPKLPPVAPGDHRLAVSVELGARHCDGIDAQPGNCLTAGTTLLTICPFRVEPRSTAASKPGD